MNKNNQILEHSVSFYSDTTFRVLATPDEMGGPFNLCISGV